MKGTRGRFVAVWVALVLVAAFGVCIPACASQMKLDCPTLVLANPDGSFSVQCTVTNHGQPGAANLILTPGVNTGSLQAVPAAAQLAKGESQAITIVGTLTNATINGTFDVVVRFVRDKDGKVVETKAVTVAVLAAVPT